MKKILLGLIITASTAGYLYTWSSIVNAASCCHTSGTDTGIDVNKKISSGGHTEGTRIIGEDGDVRYVSSVRTYEIPNISLINQNGEIVNLRKVLESDKPIALNFFFTTCTTICPVMTVTITQMEKELEADLDDLRIVSISIDPEHDTPDVLHRYTEMYRTSAEHIFLTGKVEDVIRLRKSFETYTGDKMNHEALTLFKLPNSDNWLRIDGLASSGDLAKEYRNLLKS